MSLNVSTLVSTAQSYVGKTLAQLNKEFGTSFSMDWCAWFTRQCGRLSTSPSDPYVFGNSDEAAKLKGINGNVPLQGNLPHSGDLAIMGLHHIGIITDVNYTTGVITVYSGNLDGPTGYTSSVVKKTLHKSDGTPAQGYSGYPTITDIGKNS